ncbi:hypothetical protein KUCAC02_007676, partial [Chaenocephalus aceratus]
AGVRAETAPTSPNLGRGRARLTDDQTKPPSARLSKPVRDKLVCQLRAAVDRMQQMMHALTLKLEANHDNTICIRNSGEAQRQQMRSKAKLLRLYPAEVKLIE